ncbi:IclR family transcriptional regulator [Paracoccus alkenifer]|uniref:Transcriptional regulator, IclR family n=1 Tax=Paracoccus alkenifer TaxID=65735 RepID=A0A1H6MS81_9RHOB|nr:IclR family transcriptional regulator [Paracoccus alkenifer]SEI04821.1 transcriptional regulator, IclR family [Paracoccus alkenifer]
MAENGVQSVARALSLMRLLAQEDGGSRLSDVARAAGLPVSTAHRLLTTLEQQGFAQFEPASSLWHVGRDAFTVGLAYGRRLSFVAPALPLLRRLRDATRETANLGILDDDHLVTVSQVESREIRRALSPPGRRVPVFSSAMGKAILATWRDQEVLALADRAGLPPLTTKSLRSREAALAEIARTRARGWALDDEEFNLGMRCLAAVVWSPQGEAACAISISGAAVRLTEDRLEPLGALVAQAAEELTGVLGGVAPG